MPIVPTSCVDAVVLRCPHLVDARARKNVHPNVTNDHFLEAQAVALDVLDVILRCDTELLKVRAVASSEFWVRALNKNTSAVVIQ